MDYKDAIDAARAYHFDELPEPTQEALYAAAAADKLNEVFAWLVGPEGNRGDPENLRKAKLARVETLGFILGRRSRAEAAGNAGVSERAIAKNRAAFCAVFGVEKSRGKPVREKE